MTHINWSAFNWLDTLICVIIAFSVLISLVRGFVREAVSLLIWGGAILLALRYADVLAPVFSKHIASANVRYTISAVIIFLLVLILGAIFNAFVSALVSRTGMGAVDRLAGMIFGFLRGILVVSVLLVFFYGGVVKNKKILESSQLVGYFMPVVVRLQALMPKKLSAMQQWFNGSSEDSR